MSFEVITASSPQGFLTIKVVGHDIFYNLCVSNFYVRRYKSEDIIEIRDISDISSEPPAIMGTRVINYAL